MQAGFRLGDFELTWLSGGMFALDGGAMFGVVPKPLWEKKYPADEENAIPLTAWPILVRTPKAPRHAAYAVAAAVLEITGLP